MTPYPADYGAPPQCATCLYFFPVIGKAYAPWCALRQEETGPDNACVNWVLWIATAQPVTPNP